MPKKRQHWNVHITINFAAELLSELLLSSGSVFAFYILP